MTDTFSDRVDELIIEANRRRLDHSEIQLYDPRGAVAAYADLLGMSIPFALDLSLTLKQVREATVVAGV